MLPTTLHDAALHPRPPLDQLRRLSAIYGRSVRRSIGLPVSDSESAITPEIVYQSQLQLKRAHHDVLLEEADLVEDVRVVTPGDSHPWATAGLRQIATDLPGDGTPLPCPVDPTRLGAARRELDQAIALLAQIDTYSLAIFQALVRRVVVVRSDELKSATQMPTFGAVYIESRMIADPIELPLAMVHETTHHCVGLQTLFVQLFTDPNQTTTHPLRPDPRPIFAALHATVVLLRMCQLAALARDRIGGRWPQRHADLQENLSQSMCGLSAGTTWTDDGRRYRSRLHQLVNRELS
jgi:HEXXH motif-containing protein